MPKLTETEWYATLNALRVAAERYDLDAEVMKGQGGAFAHLERTFRDQAMLARMLADRIERET